MIETPSVRDLDARASAALTAAVGAVPTTRRTVFSVFARVASVLTHHAHLRLTWLSRQLFASTADLVWLLRHGWELGLARKAAARAAGVVNGACVDGLVVPAGLRLEAADGRVYRTRASAVGSGGTIALQIIADVPGVAGNALAGTVLDLADPARPPGAGPVMTVASGGLGGGAEEESLEDFRARVLARKRTPGETGSRADWLRWTAEAPGVSVKSAWVGTFIDDHRKVYVVPAIAGRGNGVAEPSDLAAVTAHLADDVRRPLAARFLVAALIPQAVNVRIGGLVTDTAQVRAAIEAELRAMFAQRAAPALPGEPFVFSSSWVAEAVSTAAGESAHRLELPAADVVITTPATIPVLGTITYVT